MNSWWEWDTSSLLLLWTYIWFLILFVLYTWDKLQYYWMCEGVLLVTPWGCTVCPPLLYQPNNCLPLQILGYFIKLLTVLLFAIRNIAFKCSWWLYMYSDLLPQVMHVGPLSMQGRSLLDAVEMAYAKEVYVRNESMIQGKQHNLVKAFHAASQHFQDKVKNSAVL